MSLNCKKKNKKFRLDIKTNKESLYDDYDDSNVLEKNYRIQWCTILDYQKEQRLEVSQNKLVLLHFYEAHSYLLRVFLIICIELYH